MRPTPGRWRKAARATAAAPSAAPTCATCHFSGFGSAGTTHDTGDRLTWYLFAPISERRPSWQDNRVRMQSVCYFNTPLGIRNLANLRIRLNCDILYQNVNPESVKRIVRSTLRRFGSVYWPILAGQTVLPVQTAVRFRVQLIIWGAHQGLEQVGMFSHLHEVEMTRRYRKDHDLMGHEADDLLSVFDTLTEGDIWQYRYPDDAALDAVGVRGIYLGNYVRWDPKAAQHEAMIARHDYASAAFARTFDTYDHVDCFNYMDLHDQLKLFKHGYSRVTDHASREIRHGRLTRVPV